MLKINNIGFSRSGVDYCFNGTAPAGSITLIKGASGVGKSTLLDSIAGFISPKSGTISWQDTPFQQQAVYERPLSLLQQGDNLFPHLNILDNVCLGANPRWRINKEIRSYGLEMLQQVGIEGTANKYPNSVSGGQAQRAGLARSLLRHQYTPRPILLLDEPYSALDENTANNMHGLISDLCGQYKLCVLLVAHREMPKDQTWTISKNSDLVSIQT